MAPAAPPGKPRCLVSEGVWCLKVYDIMPPCGVGRGPGFPPKKFEPFFPPQNMYVLNNVYMYA